MRQTYSIEQPMGENDDYFLMDAIEDTSAVSVTDHFEVLNRYELVSKWFETLSDAEKEILTLRFGLDDRDPQTLEFIGRSFGVTRERIRQIEPKSLEKLRNSVENEQINLTGSQEIGDLKVPRCYTMEIQAEAIKLVSDQGLSLETVARRLVIPKNTLAGWIATAKVGNLPSDSVTSSTLNQEAPKPSLMHRTC